ncbi:hypothetical protein TNCV_1628391 [Trichonephila clavipes]|nr:hypothetical protein TNCV_1628391 [Trichonephila clavipes]
MVSVGALERWLTMCPLQCIQKLSPVTTTFKPFLPLAINDTHGAPHSFEKRELVLPALLPWIATGERCVHVESGKAPRWAPL